MVIDLSKLRRDPARVKRAMDIRDGVLVAKETVTVIIPQYLAMGKLGSISDSVRATGFHCYLLEDGSYAADTVPAVLTFGQTGFQKETIDDEVYLVLTYEPGSAILPSTNVIRSRTLAYDVYNAFLSRGKHPFYFNVVTRSMLFDGTEHYADISLEADHAIMEMMGTFSVRSSKDLSQEYRLSMSSQSDLLSGDYTVIPQRSVALGVADAVGKLTGSYSREGQTGALVAPTENAELLDEILTS